MTHNRLFSAIAFTFILLLAFSCKKKEDKVEYNYLNGTPKFSIPAYVQPGEVYVLHPREVTRPSDDTSTDGIGYYWSVSPITTKKDTVRTEKDAASVSADYTLTIPDTLCTITTTCSAFAEGYYSSTSEASSIIVKPYGEDRSLKGITYPDKSKVITDSRDSKKYYYTTAAGLDWFVENLAFEGAGKPFLDSPAMTDIFGMFYTWNEAAKACPAGWRLPSNEDFLALHNSLTGAKNTAAKTTFYGNMGDCMADAYLNDIKLWEFWPGVNINNKTGLAMIPAGYATINEDGNARYYGSTYYYTCWTSDEAGSDKAYYRYVYADKPDMLLGSGSKTDFASPVRCVRTSE